MEKAGTNAGLAQWCTRLAIKPGIQARSLTIVHLPGYAQGYPIGVRIQQLGILLLVLPEQCCWFTESFFSCRRMSNPLFSVASRGMFSMDSIPGPWARIRLTVKFAKPAEMSAVVR